MYKVSSIPHEYYLGDLPGNLQYAKSSEEIINSKLEDDDNDCGYKMCEHSLENLNRVMPLSQKKNDWKILALMNLQTGNVALLTSTNSENNLLKRGNRSVKTVDGNWFVGHYRMSAPMCFWRELKNRLLY
jgi:hypothetical protein